MSCAYAVRWSDGDRMFLRSRWGEVTTIEIADELGRSYWATVHMARKLKLPPIRAGHFNPAKGRVRAVQASARSDVAQRQDAEGTVVGQGRLSINIIFDAETFREVKDVAERDRLSFSRAALQLIEWGLQASANA